jgi:phosphatidylinositol kinase/protein kinase (PI-3  family)
MQAAFRRSSLSLRQSNFALSLRLRYAISKLPGDDLAQAMWLRSSNSEQWLERRSNFTRSLAVMVSATPFFGLSISQKKT